ncbi:TRAP transporter small permease [Modicisalibacter radicis]|uniref:TRAP transporter small permease n=1 Tax=Halomonas sp. EAR18 TaxID=2518972 RepID=UPI001B34ADBF|nr:TRAP transporter small permease [Halomonas sp. EAR18]
MLSNIAKWLAKSCEVICTLLLIFVSLVNISQVVGRYFFGDSLPWGEEVMRFCMIWLMMLGSVACVYRAEHMAVDGLLNIVKVKYRRHMRSALYSVGAGFCLVLVFYGWDTAMSNRAQTAAASGIPMVFPYMAIPVGGGLVFIEIALSWFAGFSDSSEAQT